MRNRPGSPDRMILDARVWVMHHGGNSGNRHCDPTYVHKVPVARRTMIW